MKLSHNLKEEKSLLTMLATRHELNKSRADLEMSSNLQYIVPKN